jgi:crotonobetainyl-CoA:carnitine CoA-transferase CaiB-like acyl-CoA transferase
MCIRARVELGALLAARLARRSSADWLAALEAAGIPAGPIRDIREAFDSPQAQAIGSRVRLDHPVLGAVDQVRPPYELAVTPAAIRRPPPLLGEHSREILHEAGYDAAAIDRLAADGVI